MELNHLILNTHGETISSQPAVTVLTAGAMFPLIVQITRCIPNLRIIPEHVRNREALAAKDDGPIRESRMQAVMIPRKPIDTVKDAPDSSTAAVPESRARESGALVPSGSQSRMLAVVIPKKSVTPPDVPMPVLPVKQLPGPPQPCLLLPPPGDTSGKFGNGKEA
ncbi:hypothetical protein HO133_001411 [Letharia lupina]|uniref:Uncharacterized protein n=1 Tax=Letharia lupina TaxID=560253 RepID=A0A8H6CFC0_9LECA|nr:uncharacterized protein HO133_001411 [Letharia lupina]KAF6222325.1 hypothetical protein HO133_001411 [Letharia lupina]